MDQEEEEIDRQRAAGRPDSELLVGFGGGSGSPVSEPVVGPSGGSGSGSPISVSEPVQSWVMQQSAQELAACLGAEPCLEGNQTWTQYSRRGLINVLYNLNMMSQHLDSKAKKLDESIEEMLIRLDEFCAMLEMIRSDSSQILDENVPKLKAKALEMKKVYAKIDKMEVCNFSKYLCEDGWTECSYT
ncbi:uncharacterized protein [Chiloscyllium punctatum]|uniref:uncharacterized protein isoform X3 n=1 Tax=Chiloscyllium punctatum TaxID=137246 RepID=UPI003B633ABC